MKHKDDKTSCWLGGVQEIQYRQILIFSLQKKQKTKQRKEGRKKTWGTSATFYTVQSSSGAALHKTKTSQKQNSPFLHTTLTYIP